jgi:hypothetical protein
MRPRLSELEMSFLLDLLKETSALKKRQILNLQEEGEYLENNIYALKKIARREAYPFYKILRSEKEMLSALRCEWLPLTERRSIILECLIVRLEKILARKTGRVPRVSFWYRIYLEKEWNQKTSEKTTSASIA